MVTQIDTRRFFYVTKDEIKNTKNYKKRNELVDKAIQYSINNKDNLDLRACSEFFNWAYIEPEKLQYVMSEIDFGKIYGKKLEQKLDFLEKNKDKMDIAKQKALAIFKEYENPQSKEDAQKFLSEIEKTIDLTTNPVIKSQIIDTVLNFAARNQELIDKNNYALFVVSNSLRKEQIDGSLELLGLSEEQKIFVKQVINKQNSNKKQKSENVDNKIVKEKTVKVNEQKPSKEPKLEKKSQIETLDNIDKIILDYHNGDGKDYLKCLQSLDIIRKNGSVIEKQKASNAISILQIVSKAKLNKKPYDLKAIEEKVYGEQARKKDKNKKIKEIVENAAEANIIKEIKQEKVIKDENKIIEKSFKDKTAKEITPEESRKLYSALQDESCSLKTALYAYYVFKGVVYAKVDEKINEKIKTARTISDRKEITKIKQVFSTVEKAIKQDSELTFGQIDEMLNPPKTIKVKEEIVVDKAKTEEQIKENEIKLEQLNHSSESLEKFKDEQFTIINSLLDKADSTYDAQKLSDFMLTYGNAELNCKFLEKFGKQIEKDEFKKLEEPSFEDEARKDKNLHLKYLKINGSNKTAHQSICISGMNTSELVDFALKHKEADLIQIYDRILYKSKYITKEYVKKSNDEALKKLDRLIEARNKESRLAKLADNAVNGDCFEENSQNQSQM